MDKEILYRFFDRQATSSEKEELRKWMEESPENREELFREREFHAAMILSGKNPERGKRTGYRYRAIIREALKIAAAVAITIAAGFYFMDKKDAGQPMLSITVPPGQRANLTLADGTNVWLNARTELHYPGTFDGPKREVVLNGEAFFDVPRKEGKPFVVHTDKCDIEVLGTQFNVEDYKDSEDFYTALMQGSVKITDNSRENNSLILSPNQLGTLRNGVLISEAITDYDYYRWREGLICFKNMGFEQLMERFEKCYGIRIQIDNRKLGNYGFSGKFRISDGIDNALRVLQKDAPYTFERNTDDSVIYIK